MHNQLKLLTTNQLLNSVLQIIIAQYISFNRRNCNRNHPGSCYHIKCFSQKARSFDSLLNALHIVGKLFSFLKLTFNGKPLMLFKQW